MKLIFGAKQNSSIKSLLKSERLFDITKYGGRGYATKLWSVLFLWLCVTGAITIKVGWWPFIMILEQWNYKTLHHMLNKCPDEKVRMGYKYAELKFYFIDWCITVMSWNLQSSSLCLTTVNSAQLGPVYGYVMVCMFYGSYCKRTSSAVISYHFVVVLCYIFR